MENQNSKIIYHGQYAAVPNAVLRDVNISIGARGLLAMLMTHSEKWRFNRKNIMSKCGCGAAKYNRMINELKAAGYLKIIPIQGENGKLDGHNWIINPHPTADAEIDPAENPPGGKPAPIRKQISKKPKSKIPPNPLKGEPSPGDIFDKLWPFIRKVTPDECMGRHSKKNGRAKFIKISTRKDNPIPAGKMAHAICWFYAQDDQQRDNGKFIKGIVPVLNGELFEAFLDKGPYGSMSEKTPEELAADKPKEYWDFWVRRFKDQGDWNAPGPNPSESGCLADIEILKNNGFDVPDDSINS